MYCFNNTNNRYFVKIRYIHSIVVTMKVLGFCIKHLLLIMAIMLLICLFDMPYGYYQLVRFVAMIVFSISAFVFGSKQNRTLMITMGILALLFQPLFPIALGRMIWNIVDVIVAIFLICLWYNKLFNGSKDRC